MRRAYDGTVAGGQQAVPAGGIAWANVRGAFMLNGALYTGYSNGSFTRQTFDGTTYGSAVPVDAADQLVVLSAWHTEVSQMTGLFFDQGRMYCTLSGRTGLYYRYLTPESDIVGATRFTASTGVSGLAFSSVRGMFLSGSKLCWTGTDGILRRTDWNGSAPVASTTTSVSGPAIDGQNWAGRALFVSQGAGGGPNQLPTASAAVACNQLTCTFDGTGSSDPDGSIASYAWTFGDGGNGAGATTTHDYGTEGTFSATLTVTDNRGGTASTTVDAHPTTAMVSFLGANSVNSNKKVHSVAIPSDVQAGDTLALFFAGGTAATPLTAPAGWTEQAAVGADGLWVGCGRTRRPAVRPARASRSPCRSCEGGHQGRRLPRDGVRPGRGVRGRAETSSRTAHTTPAVTVAEAGGGCSATGRTSRLPPPRSASRPTTASAAA